MAWKTIGVSNGRASLENDCPEPDSVPEVPGALRFWSGGRLRIGPAFGTDGATALAGGLFVDDIRLTLDWDIWSVCIGWHGIERAISWSVRPGKMF